MSFCNAIGYCLLFGLDPPHKVCKSLWNFQNPNVLFPVIICWFVRRLLMTNVGQIFEIYYIFNGLSQDFSLYDKKNDFIVLHFIFVEKKRTKKDKLTNRIDETQCKRTIELFDSIQIRQHTKKNYECINSNFGRFICLPNLLFSTNNRNKQLFM